MTTLRQLIRSVEDASIKTDRSIDREVLRFFKDTYKPNVMDYLSNYGNNLGKVSGKLQKSIEYNYTNENGQKNLVVFTERKYGIIWETSIPKLLAIRPKGKEDGEVLRYVKNKFPSKKRDFLQPSFEDSKDDFVERVANAFFERFK